MLFHQILFLLYFCSRRFIIFQELLCLLETQAYRIYFKKVRAIKPTISQFATIFLLALVSTVSALFSYFVYISSLLFSLG